MGDQIWLMPANDEVMIDATQIAVLRESDKAGEGGSYVELKSRAFVNLKTPYDVVSSQLLELLLSQGD